VQTAAELHKSQLLGHFLMTPKARGAWSILGDDIDDDSDGDNDGDSDDDYASDDKYSVKSSRAVVVCS
jgi:hypothetical protein